MTKFGELRWDELYKSESDEYSHEPTALWSATPRCGIDPLNKAKPTNAPGEVPIKPSDEDIADFILKGQDVHGAHPQGQWKDEEHLHKEIVTQEQSEQLQKDWDNKLNNIYEAAQAPIIPQEEQTNDWGDGASFNDTLTEEERLKRNMFTDE